MTPEQLAKIITDDLFTNGNGERASRLVHMDETGPTPRQRGGWCEKAVRDRVAKAIRANLDKLTKATIPEAP